MNQQPPSLAIAWQGVKLSTPPTWEPAVLDPGYLRLESRGARRLDLRWNRIKGSFDPERYIKRLKKRIKSQAILESGLGPWQEQGAPALKKLSKRDFSTAGFCWRDKKSPAAGPGAVVFNPRTRRALVFFFSSGGDEQAEPAWPRVLASLRDQSGQEWRDWAVFDLSLSLPGRFNLKRHTFRPGHFQLLFEARNAWLILERLAPADVLLSRRDISVWAEDFYKKDKIKLHRGPQLHRFEFKGVQALEWQSPAGGFLSRAAGRLGLKKGPGLTRIWQPQGTNKLLVVRRGGRGNLRPEEFQHICEHYELV